MYASKAVLDTSRAYSIVSLGTGIGKYHRYYQFNNTPCQVINGIRRTIMKGIPTMRIDDILVNDSHNIRTLSEEIFFQKLGNLRIIVNEDMFVYEDEIDRPHPWSGVKGSSVKAPSWKPRYEADYILTEIYKNGNIPRPGKPRLGTHFDQTPNDPDERSCLKFELDVTCYYDVEKQCLMNQKIYPKDIKWIPIGNQSTWLSKNSPHFNDDMLIAELSEGERISLLMYAVKGNGFEMNKWSPAICSYAPVRNDKFLKSPTCCDWIMEIESFDCETDPTCYLLQALNHLANDFRELGNDMTRGIVQR